MGAILSSAFKNGDIRVAEFLPIIDFRLFSFGFVDNVSLDGSKRENVPNEEQIEDPQLITQVSLSSGTSLDDLLIPDGLGDLENISYHGARKIIEPQIPMPSYLFFDSAQSSNPLYPSPKYLVYAHFMPHDATPYARGYIIGSSIAKYFAEAQYKPIERTKIYSTVVDYSRPYIAPVSLFYLENRSYVASNSSAARVRTQSRVNEDPKIHAKLDAIVSAKSVFLNIPLQNAAVNSYVIVQMVMPTLIYATRHILTSTTPPKTDKPQDYPVANPILHIPQTKPYVYSRTDFQSQPIINPQSAQLPKKSATLDENVRIIYKNSSMIFDKSYVMHKLPQLYQTIPTVPNASPQTETQGSKLEPRLKEAPVQAISYRKLQLAQPYIPDKKFATPSSNQNVNQKKVRYIIFIPTQKTDIQSFKRNYDNSPRWINVLSSNYWKTKSHYLGIAEIKQNSTAENRYEQEPSKPQENEAGKTVRYLKRDPQGESQKESELYSKIETEIKPVADKDEATDTTAQKIKSRYETKKKDENQETENPELKVKTNYKLKDDGKKPNGRESSALKYAGYIGGAAAGVGLMGLAKLGSLLFRKKPTEAERPNLYLISNNITNESQTSQAKTIDSVVEPPKNNETVFTQEFRENIEFLIKRVEQLGYGNVSISIRNNLTGEYYGCNDRKQEPQPSHAKIAIAFAGAYLAQKGLLNLNKKIDFDPDLDRDMVLQRETDDYKEFKSKNQFDYNYLQKLMIRDSNNTATNLILKFIGNGDVYEGMKIVNKVMREVDLGDINVEAPYNRIFDYTKNVATTEAIERLMGYILKGEYLKPKYSSPIKDDLQNERWMKAFRDKLQGVTSGTKVHIHKHGTGFAAYLGDYTVAVSFNDSKTELYTDEARSAKHLLQELNEINEKRVTKPIYTASNHEFGEIFNLLRRHSFNLNYQQPYKKAA